VREIIKYGADVIKVCATGGVLSKGDDPRASQYTLEEMKAIVADAHRLGRKVAAHAHGAQGIAWASEAGVDSIEHGSYIDDAAIAIMKKHGTYLVPTQYLGDWMRENAEKIGLPAMYAEKMRSVTAVSRKNLKRACRSKGRIRHRCRRLPAWPQCPRIWGLRPDGHDSDSGHPDSNRKRR
jgi:imidazolonepropionase-like amidohydrolase